MAPQDAQNRPTGDGPKQRQTDRHEGEVVKLLHGKQAQQRELEEQRSRGDQKDAGIGRHLAHPLPIAC